MTHTLPPLVSIPGGTHSAWPRKTDHSQSAIYCNNYKIKLYYLQVQARIVLGISKKRRRFSDARSACVNLDLALILD